MIHRPYAQGGAGAVASTEEHDSKYADFIGEEPSVGGALPPFKDWPR